jgi:hypothetical protein
MGGTMFQVTVIDVEELAITFILLGGLAGSEMKKSTIIMVYNTGSWILTMLGCHISHSTTVRPSPHTGVGSDRYAIVDEFFQICQNSQRFCT